MAVESFKKSRKCAKVYESVIENRLTVVRHFKELSVEAKSDKKVQIAVRSGKRKFMLAAGYLQILGAVLSQFRPEKAFSVLFFSKTPCLSTSFVRCKCLVTSQYKKSTSSTRREINISTGGCTKSGNSVYILGLK